MRPGRYAAADGSFGRSAGVAMGRGVLLLAVALVIGIVLLNKTDDEPPGTSVSAETGGRPDAASAGGDDGEGRATPTTTTTTTAPVRQPQEVKVIVANASEVKGAAGRATDRLKAASYNALAPTNATSTATSAVYFTPGFDREAGAIAQSLELPATTVKPMPTPAPVTDLKTANVLVILGADAASRFGTATSSGGSSTTSTSAPASTTTTTTR